MSTHTRFMAWVLAGAIGLTSAAVADAGVLAWQANGTFTEAALATYLPAPALVVYAQNFGGNSTVYDGITFATSDQAAQVAGTTQTVYHFRLRCGARGVASVFGQQPGV